MKTLLAIVLTAVAQAVPVNFAWDTIGPKWSRIRTHLFTLGQNNQKIFLAEAWGDAGLVSVEMTPGVYQVTATSEYTTGIWWDFCEPITVVVALPPPAIPLWTMTGNTLTTTGPAILDLSIEFSSDLRSWHSEFLPTDRFARIKISTAP